MEVPPVGSYDPVKEQVIKINVLLFMIENFKENKKYHNTIYKNHNEQKVNLRQGN